MPTCKYCNSSNVKCHVYVELDVARDSRFQLVNALRDVCIHLQNIGLGLWNNAQANADLTVGTRKAADVFRRQLYVRNLAEANKVII